jgi:hypothetical protein
MDPSPVQQLTLVGEETLHTGENVMQVFAIGHAVENLVSGKIPIVPSQFSSGLPACKLTLENAQRGLFEQVAGGHVGSADVDLGDGTCRLLAALQSTGINFNEWNAPQKSPGRDGLAEASTVERNVLLAL